MTDDVRAPADDIADGKTYLGLAQDIENLIEDLKLRHKATHDLGDLLSDTGFEKNSTGAPENSGAFAAPGRAQGTGKGR